MKSNEIELRGGLTGGEEHAVAQPRTEVRVLDALGDEFVAGQNGLHQLRGGDDDDRTTPGPRPVDGAVCSRPLQVGDLQESCAHSNN